MLTYFCSTEDNFQKFEDVTNHNNDNKYFMLPNLQFALQINPMTVTTTAAIPATYLPMEQWHRIELVLIPCFCPLYTGYCIGNTKRRSIHMGKKVRDGKKCQLAMSYFTSPIEDKFLVLDKA